MKRWSLRTRFMVAYAGLIVLGFTGLAVIAGREISQGAVEDFEVNLETQVSIVARGLIEHVEHYQEGETSRQTVVNAVNDFANSSGTRIRLIDSTGKAWLDSTGEVPSGDLLAFSEVAAARDGR
ncbi:MAG: cell wall metabolism sensor histidine kinase WalK, partial [Chloroflexi bacterium]|nr:cell wall metabolism sensor histidine kinase WalK [Chloroflexota bacterium]